MRYINRLFTYYLLTFYLLAESNGSLPTHVTCSLTAKNRDQLRNPTLGNRVWATFTFTFACRPPPPRRRPGKQLRLAARPPTRSDVVRHAKCKHAVDCRISLNINFFTIRHTTRAIYRLTVQTLPDGLETQFTPPDTTQTGPSCLVWRAV